jgi:23S rRNA (uridine2552-2'-O)-methyltransferase
MAKRPFERKDRFYFKAKKEGYPARSAYKIMELDDRFKIFKPGRKIVDLGCAPGGWMKVAQERLSGRGKLAGIDLLPIKFALNETSFFVEGDFLDPANQAKLKEFLGGPADWVICDISPNISGIKFRDEFQSYELAMKALQFTVETLKQGGGFLFKNFPGPEIEDLRRALKTHFAKIKTVVPEATRQSSTEIYIVCTEKKGGSPGGTGGK